MATLETQQLDEIIVNSRRKMLALGGAALAGLAFAGVKLAEGQAVPAYTDADILNFALVLEMLETDFYKHKAKTLALSGETKALADAFAHEEQQHGSQASLHKFSGT